MPSSPIEWSPSPPLPPRQVPNEPAIGPEVIGNTSATTSTRGSQRSRGQARRGRATRGVSRRERGGANVRDVESLATDGRNQPDEEFELAGRTKKGRNRGMNPQKKLVLIRECVKHADDYKPGTKGAFWTTIRDLLKDRTGYDLVEPRNTVLRWVKARIDELVEEEMGSGTQVDQDDFKAAVEVFRNRWEIVENEIKQSKQSNDAQAAELFEAARVQKAMVFELDDEPIAGIDSAEHGSNARNASIALNSSNRKQKREADSGPSHDAILLAGAFEKSTGMLAKALVAGQRSDTRSSSSFPSTPPTQAPSSNNLGEFNQRMTKVETGLEGMATELGDMKNMLGRIFAAVSGGGQVHNASATSTDNSNTSS